MPASAPPAAIAAEVPAARLVGEGRLRWLGFSVYVAQLWGGSGFDAAQLERHSFALELRYLVDLRAADIARRSIEEMRRAGPIDDATAARWQEALARVLPDVKAGDRIAGIHRPGHGAKFLVNGRLAGEVADAVFAARFFRIWLGPATSEPQLRDALLGKDGS